METVADHAVDPRVLRTRRIVLEAVMAELGDVGHAGFTVESIAARAGVGKSTVYRHWAGKGELIADALETLNVQPRIDASLAPREAIEQLLVHLAHAMDDSPVAGCVPALIEAAERDGSIRSLFHRYSALRRRPLQDAIARGIESGDVPSYVNPERAAEALSGAIFYRRLMTDAPVAAEEVPQLIATVLGPPKAQ